MDKYDAQKIKEHFLFLHRSIKSDLKAVCWPKRSLKLNIMLDYFQKFVVKRLLTNKKIDIKEMRILDIGCGRGRWLDFYRSYGAKSLCGIDISDIAVASCKKKGYEGVVGSVTNMPFCDSSFDLISSYTVLLHLTPSDQKIAVREIKRVLKKRGIVIILECTWNDPTPWVYGRTVGEWRELFGGKVIYTETVHFFRVLKLLKKIESLLPGFGKLRFLTEKVVIPLEYLSEAYLLRKFEGQNVPKSTGHLMAMFPNLANERESNKSL